jgi:hypothetical protein
MYIDPSTGGMLFQVLAVAFGAIMGTVFMFSGKIKMGIAQLRRKFRKEEEATEEPKTEENK